MSRLRYNVFVPDATSSVKWNNVNKPPGLITVRPRVLYEVRREIVLSIDKHRIDSSVIQLFFFVKMSVLLIDVKHFELSRNIYFILIALCASFTYMTVMMIIMY